MENIVSHNYIPTQESDQPQYQDTPTQSTGTKKPRKQNSWVWEHVTLDPVDENRCCYNYCGLGYTCPRGGGVGHIARHLQKCLAKHNKEENTDLRQSKLQLGSSGLANWKYNAEGAKGRIIKYIVEDEQPFSLSENKKFQSCVQDCLNPQFQGHSRNTTKNIIYKTFKKDKQDLMRIFFSLLCRVSLTCDVWTGPNNYLYLCLTAHWIDIGGP